MNLGDKVPALKFQATSGIQGTLADFQGKWVILYFYPKDSTPGCTREGCDFRDLIQQFKQEDAMVFGISRDGLKSHESFKLKQRFPFELISDQDESFCQAFKVLIEKNMFKKFFLGIRRSTFIIGPDQTLRHAWYDVKVAGHVQEVLEKFRQLKENQ